MEVLSFTIWAGGALRDMEVMASRGLVAHPNIIMEEVARLLLIFLSNRGEGSTTIFVKRMEVPPHPQPSCKPAGGRRGG